MASTNVASTKIDITLAAAWQFISSLFVEGADRAMVASFGNSFKVETDFTGDKARVRTAFGQVGRSVTNEGTRLYESIGDAITAFWQGGRRDAGWGLFVLTDGKQCHQSSNPLTPEAVGLDIARRFNHEPTNFPVVIGVGRGDEIDVKALTTIGKHGDFPAVALEGFEYLERLFMEIAFSLTTELHADQYRLGNITWEEIKEVRHNVRHRPMDYLFLIDRSGSMKGPAFPAQGPAHPSQPVGVNGYHHN